MVKVFCENCLVGNSLLVILDLDNPFEFECPKCSGGVCVNITAALKHHYETDIKKYNKLRQLLIIAEGTNEN